MRVRISKITVGMTGLKNPVRDPHVMKRESWLKNFVLGLTAKLNPTRLPISKDKLTEELLKKKYILTTTAEICEPYSFIYMVPMI